MKKGICILGCGMQGSAIGNKLLDYGYDVTCVDISEENLSRFKGKKEIYDIRDNKIIDFLKDFKVVINAVPAKLGLTGIKTCVKAKVDTVDISFIEEDITDYKDYIGNSGITLIPDAGVAPGLSNICSGNAFKRFCKLDRLKIYVGGIPKEPNPPLNLCVTFNPNDLLSEYERKVRFIENGRLKVAEPLSDREIIYFNSDEYECFLTDGLRTLIKSIKCDNMFEKTIRYKGHSDWIMKTKKEEILKILIEYSRKNIKDKILFRVIAESKDKKIQYEMIDYYDEENNVTAMARTTGYTAMVIAMLLFEGKINKKGLVLPEELGMDENIFSKIVELLKDTGINLEIKENI